MSSSLLHAAVVAAALLLSGCAALDPHDVLGRRVSHLEPPGDGVAAPLGDTGRRLAIDHVWTTVSQRYYDPSLNGVDWAAARRRWEPEALRAPDDEAFWRVLDRMTGELRDAHTRVESPARAALRERSESVSLGALFKYALVFSSSESQPLNNYAFNPGFGYQQPNDKTMVGGSLARDNFYSILGTVKVAF